MNLESKMQKGRPHVRINQNLTADGLSIYVQKG